MSLARVCGRAGDSGLEMRTSEPASQQVPRDVMEVGKHDVVELWIGKRGYHLAGSQKLVLVKNGNGEVIAWNMDVRLLVENGKNEHGEEVQGVHGQWTDALLFSNAQEIWQFKPGCETEDPLTPGEYQWSDA